MYITHHNAETAREWAITNNAALCCVCYPDVHGIVVATTSWGQNIRPQSVYDEALYAVATHSNVLSLNALDRLAELLLAEDARFIR